MYFVYFQVAAQRPTLGLFICQNVSDLQILNSFKKLRSFWIEVTKGIFSKPLFRGRKFDLKIGIIPKEINTYKKHYLLW